MSQSICSGFFSRLGCNIIKAHFNCSLITKGTTAFTKFTQFQSVSSKSASFFIIFFPKCFIFHIYFVEWFVEKSLLSPVSCCVYSLLYSRYITIKREVYSGWLNKNTYRRHMGFADILIWIQCLKSIQLCWRCAVFCYTCTYQMFTKFCIIILCYDYCQFISLHMHVTLQQ